MSVVHENADSRPARTLIVFLPGLKDRARVFEKEGFVELVRQHHLAADIVEADAHVGYYVKGNVVRRLERDVIEPAERRRYQRIILVGVSMGGYGAVRYVMAHPNQIAEIVLLSPFLGAGPFERELAQPNDPDFKETWDWINHFPVGKPHPRIVLGYGHLDAFVKTDRDLAERLPPADVINLFGAHIWPTWHKLFEQMLERQLLDE